MTTSRDWVVLDTNVWIFGLRNQPDRSACYQILQGLSQLHVKVPRQILLELRANLSREELRALFRFFKYYPDQVDFRWERVELALLQKYQQLGRKLGDAAVAAHIEAMGVKTLVSENRDFLEEIKSLPFRVLSAAELLQTLGEGG